MRLTKLGHACVRIEHDGRTLVIDPGGFSKPDAAVGADAVLITHEHPDHLDEARLRAATDANPALEIWTNPSVATLLDGIGAPVHTVGHGDAFEAAGFDVQVHGEFHAMITLTSPWCATSASWSPAPSSTRAIRSPCPTRPSRRCSYRSTRPG